MTSAHDKTATRIAAPDTQTVMQTVDDDDECPVFFDSGFVGKAEYNGLTRFLQIPTSKLIMPSSVHHCSFIRSLLWAEV